MREEDLLNFFSAYMNKIFSRILYTIPVYFMYLTFGELYYDFAATSVCDQNILCLLKYISLSALN